MSIVLKSARITELFFTLILIVATYYYLWRAIRGHSLLLRLLPAVAAISEGVDKAVEEGKPVFASPGNMAYLSGLNAPMTVAGINVARYTAALCVKKGARIILPVPANPETLPLIDGIFREVCVTEGKPEAYNRDDVRYYGPAEYSFAIGCSRDIQVDGCSCLVAVGANSTTEKYMLGIAYLGGALTIGGTPRWGHQPTNIIMADYFLIAEDCYAAGAYVTGDNVVCSSMVGNDVFKWAIILTIVAATILTVAGFPVVKTGGWLFQ